MNTKELIEELQRADPEGTAVIHVFDDAGRLYTPDYIHLSTQKNVVIIEVELRD